MIFGNMIQIQMYGPKELILKVFQEYIVVLLVLGIRAMLEQDIMVLIWVIFGNIHLVCPW
jgi:hypothetical protein